jgi:hypothetical protein
MLFSVRLAKGFINLLLFELLFTQIWTQNAVNLASLFCVSDLWIFQCQSSVFVMGSRIDTDSLFPLHNARYQGKETLGEIKDGSWIPLVRQCQVLSSGPSRLWMGWNNTAMCARCSFIQHFDEALNSYLELRIRVCFQIQPADGAIYSI